MRTMDFYRVDFFMLTLVFQTPRKNGCACASAKNSGKLNPTFVNKNMAFKQLRQVKKRKKNLADC